MVKRFERIVACTDFSDVGNRAIETAFGLAHGGNATVCLVHVLDPPPMPNPMYAHYITQTPWDPSALKKASADVIKGLQDLVPPGVDTAGVEVTFETPQGTPSYEILHLAKQREAEVVVLGTRGRAGIEQLLLGSVAERVVRRASCAVMVVH